MKPSERIYLASSGSQRIVMQEWSAAFIRAGFFVTSRWVYGPPLPSDDSPEVPSSARAASECLSDIQDADTFVTLLPEFRRPTCRGGAHIEFGYALALGLRIFTVGRPTAAFHFLPEVSRFETFPSLLGYLREEVRDSISPSSSP